MLKKQVTYDSEEISGEKLLSMDETLQLFNNIDWYKGAFMYFPIDEKYLFQIMCEGEDVFIIEFTDTTDATSYQKRVGHDECCEAIVELFEKTEVSPDMLAGFENPDKGKKTVYDSVKGSWWKNILFWIIFIGFFVGLAVLGAYLIYW